MFRLVTLDLILINHLVLYGAELILNFSMKKRRFKKDRVIAFIKFIKLIVELIYYILEIIRDKKLITKKISF